MAEQDQPQVQVHPGWRYGYAHVGGIACDMVAAQVWAGLSVHDIAVDYGLTRPQVLLACWFEARHSRPRRNPARAWQQWLRSSEGHLAADRWELVADPPSKRQVTRWG